MGDISFRLLTRDDFPLLESWLSQPHVLRWWNHQFTSEAVERDFGASVDGGEPSESHLALLDGEPIGLILYSRFDDYPEYLEELSPILEIPQGAVTIDYLIGDPTLTGRGVGSAMIAGFVEHIWQVNPEATCIIVPVNSANQGSWRALEKAGFRIVARGELEPDNPVDDPSHEVLRLDRT